ncbi:toprim domain-containing protein [Shimia thalassica]|uniref:DUF7146 domain-containing protein n=1 Tax=Shimia thalassica TaxID=1715693 RepID=UPI001C08E486|nr:toprim domain-containing protein [Shimia thalassica]MBU2942936.1 toprim domain-containing protein [Shimia thalassica]MDO6502741.1 toprim domain-containing protein [Shimia thalassica]
MNARDLTHNLRGKWHGRYGTAPCPVCQFAGRKDQAALTLADSADGRLLLNCKKTDCNFLDLLAAAGITGGDYSPPSPVEQAARTEEELRQTKRKAAQAAKCWREAQPIAGTLADVYLGSRGLTVPLGDRLRYHPACWHGRSAQRLPAMIAAITHFNGTSEPAVHRTFLAHNGVGKAEVIPAKAMLGKAAGGCVQLSQGGGTLVVAEGIETGLSLLSGLLTQPATVVAGLSASGVRSLGLPTDPGKLILAPDGDPAGREAAHALGEQALLFGWSVSVMDPGDGVDWNDVLLGELA